MIQDVRYSLRVLAKHRGFAALTSLVLALGLGINTALFSIVYSVFYKPLPIHEPSEVVYLYSLLGKGDRRPTVMAGRDYEFFRDHLDSIAAMTAHWGVRQRLTIGVETELSAAEWVAANYFDVLGVKPILGRTFLAEDEDVTSTERSLIISHDLWVRRFGSDPNVVGRQVRVGRWYEADQDFTVVGVMGPGFKGVNDPWTPTEFWTTLPQATPNHRGSALAPIARLKPGVGVEQARANLAAVAAELRRTLRHRENSEYVLYSSTEARMPFDPTARVVPVRLAAALTIVAAMVLLIASANIAGLLLARGVSRAGETAVRVVIGASRWRVARQLLVESLMLAGCGGAFGFVVAYWLLAAFRSSIPGRFVVDVAIEPPVVAVAVLLCLAVGMSVGLVPALRASRTGLSALPGFGVSGQNVRSRLRYLVVVPQVALSLVLLVVAGVQVRGVMRLELANLGYDTGNVVVLSLASRLTPGSDDTDAQKRAEHDAKRSRARYRQALAALQQVPGTLGVALASGLPLHGNQYPSFTAISQDDFHAGIRGGLGSSRMGVSPGYFSTMGMTILTGRDFDERDTMTTPPVAVISESVAKRLWPGRNAVGRFVAASNNFANTNEKIEWLEVVGVVNEVDPVVRDVGQTPFVYVSHGQEWRVSAGIVVARVHGDPQAAIQQLRRAAPGGDPFVDVHSVRTMNQIVGEILYPRRLAAGMLAASGLIGLLLAGVGLYGVVSYSVAQRVHEIGVRTALGARRADILQLVLGEGARVAAIGSLLGLVGAYAAIKVTAKMFVALPAVDLVVIGVVPLVLGSVVLAACYLPARRAARVDPMAALREL